MQAKPRVLVARAVFPEVIARLSQQLEVHANQVDEVWSKAMLTQRLAGMQGVFTDWGRFD